MGRELIRDKKKSRLRGALPETGQKDGPGKGGTPADHRIAEMGIRSRRFSWRLALTLFLSPVTVAAWFGELGRCN